MENKKTLKSRGNPQIKSRGPDLRTPAGVALSGDDVDSLHVEIES